MSFLSVVAWMPRRQTVVILHTRAACGAQSTLGPILQLILDAFDMGLSRSIS